MLARQTRERRAAALAAAAASTLTPAAVVEAADTTGELHELIFSHAAAAIESNSLLATIPSGGRPGIPLPPPAPGGVGHLPTALEVAITAENLDILTVPRMQQLLDKKWARFASAMFLKAMLSTVAYLAIFALTGILRSNLLLPPNEDGAEGADARRLFRPIAECPAGHFTACVSTTVGEWLVVLGALYKLSTILMRFRNVGWKRFFDAGEFNGVALLAFVCCSSV